MKEELMALDCERYLQTEMGLSTAREVPVLGRRIDVVGFIDGLEEIVAVEVKIGNWRQALRQALFYKLCADKVFLAFDLGYAMRICTNQAFEGIGLGVIGLDDGASRVLIEAKEIDVHQQVLRDDLINQITNLGGL